MTVAQLANMKHSGKPDDLGIIICWVILCSTMAVRASGGYVGLLKCRMSASVIMFH